MTQHEFDLSGKSKKKTLWERWTTYHEANPHILITLTNMAFKASRAGRKNIGIAMFIEVLRWENTIQTVQTNGFKIDSSLASIYARVIMRNNPELQGIFKLKKSEADPHFPDLKDEHP